MVMIVLLCNFTIIHSIVHLKVVNFMVCKYHNTTKKEKKILTNNSSLRLRLPSVYFNFYWSDTDEVGQTVLYFHWQRRKKRKRKEKVEVE